MQSEKVHALDRGISEEEHITRYTADAVWGWVRFHVPPEKSHWPSQL